MFLAALTAFSLKTSTGGLETLFPVADRKATVVYIVLGECPIAREFSPEIRRIAQDYGKRGVRFVMAYADATPATMRAQMKAFGLSFTAAKASRELIGLTKAVTVPTAALIGANGHIAYVGRIDDRFPVLGVQRKPRRHDLRIAIDQFLAGKPANPSRTEVVGCNLPNS